MKNFNHFVPSKNGRLSVWAANYKDKIALHGAALGLSAEQIAVQQTAAQGVVDGLNRIEQKKSELGQVVYFQLRPGTLLVVSINYDKHKVQNRKQRPNTI